MAKTNYRLGALRPVCRMFWGISRKIMRRYYVSAILPMIAFATLRWCTASPGRIKSLARIQRRAQLLITGGRFATSFAALNVESRLLPFDLYLKQRAMIKVMRLQALQYKNYANRWVTTRIQQRQTTHLSPVQFGLDECCWNRLLGQYQRNFG